MTTSDVRIQIARYLQGSLTAEELEEALPDGWLLDESDDPALRDLTLQTMGYLAEYFAGDRTEFDLRASLTPDAAWITETLLAGASVAVVVDSPRTKQFSGADTGRPVELV